MKPACRSCDTASASSATWILLLLLSSAAQLGLCLGHGTGSASSSHTGVPASNNLRRLQQAPAPPPSASPKASAPPSARSATGNATTAPQQPGLCKFDDAQERCTPTHDAWKSAGPGMPSSHYRRAVLMASERERHCSQHTTPQACAADWKMRCFRQGAANATNARCASSDMEEMLVFSAKVRGWLGLDALGGMYCRMLQASRRPSTLCARAAVSSHHAHAKGCPAALSRAMAATQAAVSFRTTRALFGRHGKAGHNMGPTELLVHRRVCLLPCCVYVFLHVSLAGRRASWPTWLSSHTA